MCIHFCACQVYFAGPESHLDEPLHTTKQDAKFWAIFRLEPRSHRTDKHTVNQFPNSRPGVGGTWGSRFGAAYLVPISGFFMGQAGARALRECGLIGLRR